MTAIHLVGLEIDPDAGFVRWRGRSIELRPMEFRLLVHLAMHPERVHTRASLLEEVWRSGGDTGRTVDVHIARLRRALDGAGRAIVTVRRVGYRFDPSRLEPSRPEPSRLDEPLEHVLGAGAS